MLLQGPSSCQFTFRQNEGLNEAYPFTETTKPVSQGQLVGVLVVTGDSSNRHVPLVSYGANRSHVILHGKVHVTRPRQNTFPALLLALLRSLAKALHD